MPLAPALVANLGMGTHGDLATPAVTDTAGQVMDLTKLTMAYASSDVSVATATLNPDGTANIVPVGSIGQSCVITVTATNSAGVATTSFTATVIAGPATGVPGTVSIALTPLP